MGETEITTFHTWLATDRKVAASTQNQTLAALLFLYMTILSVELDWMDGIVRAKRPVRVPVVLTKDEVRAVLTKMTGTNKLLAHLLCDTPSPPICWRTATTSARCRNCSGTRM
jgi:hypothetical protein